MAVLDFCKEPKNTKVLEYCERCGKEHKQGDGLLAVTVNCDTFEVVLGHDVDTGYHNKQVLGNGWLGKTCAKRIGLL